MILTSFTNEYNVIINKYNEYAEMIIPYKTTKVYCKIRLKDIPIVKSEKWKYTFRNKKHQIIRRFTKQNTNCEQPILEVICGDKATGRLKPIKENSLEFDIRDLCDLIEEGKYN